MADTRLELAWALDSRFFGQEAACVFAETQAEGCASDSRTSVSQSFGGYKHELRGLAPGFLEEQLARVPSPSVAGRLRSP